MRLLQAKLCRILDGDNTFGFGDEGGQRIKLVVLPEPVPPETMGVIRALTVAASSTAMFRRRTPSSTGLAEIVEAWWGI